MMPKSWSVPHDPGKNPRYAPEGQAIIKAKTDEKIAKGLDMSLRENRVYGPPFESYDGADNYFLDGGNTQSALQALDKLKGLYILPGGRIFQSAYSVSVRNAIGICMTAAR